MTRGFARSAIGPAVVFGSVLAFTVTLTVLWNVVLAKDYLRIRELARQESERTGAFHSTFIALGSSLFLAIIVLVVILATRLFMEIRWSRLTSGFVASVSHELNSPLSSIKLHAQTLARDKIGDADRARFAGFILGDVERLASLIGNILRAAQIDRHRLRLDLREVELRPYIAEYVDRATNAAPALVGAGDGPDATVRLDPAIFRQALDNILDNAVKYAKSDGNPPRIVIRTAPAGPGRIGVEVEDDGIGIPPRELRQVFDRFYRIEDGDPKRSRHGTGLGLAIVKAIVAAHGGPVAARCDGPGRGATIRIELPTGAAPVEEATVARAAGAAPS